MSKFVCFISLLFAMNTFGQNTGSITGKILDLEMNNEPLIFANVHLIGESKVVQSNFHGNFEVKNLPDGEYTIRISYLGYDDLEFIVKVEKNQDSKIICGLSAKTMVLNQFGSSVRDSNQYISAHGQK